MVNNRNIDHMFILKPITLLGAMLYAGALAAANYYVSTTGNNNNTGLSPQAAFHTLQHAADRVAAGDTVFVANGTYAGFDVREAYGTAAKPIVFKTMSKAVLINQPGPIRNDGINIENCSYIVIDGFKVNNMPGNGNGIRVVLADHCVVRNCACDRNAERGIFTGFTDDILIEYNVCTNSVDEHGIYVSNSSDRPIVRYNICYGNNNIGIHFNGDLSAGGDGIISGAQVYGNVLYSNNRAAGINMDGVENPVIYNNLIYNNHFAQGIALFQEDGAIPSRGAKIYNNTIIVPADGRWGILVSNGSNVGTEIYNNIIINQHAWRGAIAMENTAGFKCNYNIVSDKMGPSGDGSAVPLATWRQLGLDMNSLQAPDLSQIFVDASMGDFHLQEGSPAVNAGTDQVKQWVKNDLEGSVRPAGAAYDIGAYERQVATGARDVNTPLFRLFPNPAGDELFLEMEDRKPALKEICLRDIHGKVVRRFPPDAHRLDIQGIAKGVYFLELGLGIGVVVWEKVILQ